MLTCLVICPFSLACWSSLSLVLNIMGAQIYSNSLVIDSNHREDNCHREFIRSKNNVMKFYRGAMNANKVILENLVAVRQLREIYIYKPMEQPIKAGCLEGCDWLFLRFIYVNFSRLMGSNQIFRNDFVCLSLLPL